MIFRKDPQKLKARLQDLKKVKVHGMRFLIKKINPFLDFAPEDMPQIFTDYLSLRKPSDPNTVDLIKAQKDIYKIIEASVVQPSLVPIGAGDKKGKEDGITVEDLFRDPEMGYKLYNEILIHSLNRFKGLKSLFFSIKMRYMQFTARQKSMAELQSKSSSPTEITA